MDTILRAAVTYVFIVLMFRIAGQRTVAQLTSFDLLLIVIIAEVADNGLLPDDNSLTTSMLLIVTLIMIDVAFSLWKHGSRTVDEILEGAPLVIVHDGKLLLDRMDKERIDEDDVLSAAREKHGIERLDQIKLAILERSGGISIVPKDSARR